MSRRARVLLLAALTVAASLGYVAGVNSPWVTNAVYVSRVTGAPLMQVLAPSTRPWFSKAVEAAAVPVEDNDDDEEAI